MRIAHPLRTTQEAPADASWGFFVGAAQTDQRSLCAFQSAPNAA